MILFNKLIKALNKKSLVVNRCSFCDYGCAYTATDSRVYYDSGCFCISGPARMRQVSTHELKDFAIENKRLVESFIQEAGVQ